MRHRWPLAAIPIIVLALPVWLPSAVHGCTNILVTKFNDGYVAEEGQDPERGYPESWLRQVIRARPDQFGLEQESAAETELPY